MRRLLSYLKPHIGKVFVSVFMVLCIVVSELARPVIIGDAIDENIAKGDFAGLVYRAFLFLAMLVMGFLFNWLNNRLLQRVGQDIVFEIRNQTYSHINEMDINYFNMQPVGKLTTRVTNDADAISELFSNILIKLFKNGIKILGYVVVMLYISLPMALVCFVTLPIVVILTRILGNKLRKAYDQIRNKLTELNTFLSEHLMGMKLTQIFNMEDTEVSHFDEISNDLMRANRKEVSTYAVFRPLIYLTSVFALIFVIGVGSYGVLNGWLSLGLLFVFITYINELYDPIQEMAEQFGTLQQAIASANKIFVILDEKMSETEQPLTDQSLTDNLLIDKLIECGDKQLTGRIEFKNVWFSYIEGEYILKNVSFVIEPGEKVAFVGSTGAGKSTILNLIGRYFDIDDGQILIDGVDIRDMDVQTLRKSIGQVQQDVYLFTGNIRDNITLGREDISEEDIKKALVTACADGFVSELEDGIDSKVTERGSTLSAGQRQLISFARTLCYDPKILVLDEATANIDTETEQLITKAIDQLMDGRTTIMVAHRLSTIQKADRIYVLGYGEILEQGSHSELLANNGVYRKLYELQRDDVE